MRRLWGKDQERQPSRFLTEIEDQSLFQISSYDPSEKASEEDIQDYLAEFWKKVN